MSEHTTVSYCVVNTGRAELLAACLDAIGAEREALDAVGIATETLVLDNATRDGSAARAASHPGGVRLLPSDLVRGKPDNANDLFAASNGEFCLLLDDDAALDPGATAALVGALREHPRAAVAGAALRNPAGAGQPSAWRFPGVATALAGAAMVHKLYTVQGVAGTSDETTTVDWVQSAAMLVRREAALAVGGMDPRFFVYSDEVDFQKRLRGAGWEVLFVPAAGAVHHEQLATGRAAGRRIVEFSRNRDEYVRKHHGARAAAAVRLLTAWVYLLRAAAAAVLPGHSPRRYMRHVTATLFPRRGAGLREAADELNARRSAPAR